MDGDWDETKEPCLIHTLRICGIRQSYLLHLKANIPGYFVNRSILKKVAELSNVYIVFHYAGANELTDGSRHRTRKAYYGKPEDPTIKVACFQNHLFAFEDTIYSGYSIRNYDSVKSENEWWHIVGKDKNGRFIRKPNRPKLNSLELVLVLFRNGLFEESRRYLRYPKFNHRAVLHDDLISVEQEPYHFKQKEPYDAPIYFMADLECATGGERHVPIVSGFCCENGDFYQFVGPNCVTLMFDKIVQLSHDRSDVFVFFHNLKYDWAAMSRYIRNISTICKKNNQLYTCLIYHRKRKIMLRDSCKLIAAQLKDFQKMFHLSSGKKEAIPYDYYTEDNILLAEEMVDIDEVKEYFIIESEKEVFEEVLLEEYNEGCHNFEVDLEERQFNPVQYYTSTTTNMIVLLYSVVWSTFATSWVISPSLHCRVERGWMCGSLSLSVVLLITIVGLGVAISILMRCNPTTAVLFKSPFVVASVMPIQNLSKHPLQLDWETLTWSPCIHQPRKELAKRVDIQWGLQQRYPHTC